MRRQRRKLAKLRKRTFVKATSPWPYSVGRIFLSLLGEHDDVVQKHFSDIYVTNPSKNSTVEEIEEATTEILRSQSKLEDLLSSPSRPTIALHPAIPGDHPSRKTPEYDAALDEARDFIDANNPKQALGHLEHLRQRIWSRGDDVVKFRILANMGAAKLALQSQEEAARLFLEALQYDPQN
jgi:hypothetical protein